MIVLETSLLPAWADKILLPEGWKTHLQAEFIRPYMSQLVTFLKEERQKNLPIYPPKDMVFNAFRFSDYDATQVVIIGQDPYHGPGQAQGLSFSVARGTKIPPSLVNIYRELEDDLGIPPASHGCLEGWAKQGVLLLNATLTVRHKEPLSHHGKGWELFTDAVVRLLIEREDPVIFVLWGKSAKEKCALLQTPPYSERHFVITSPHPSPYSAYGGFFGSRPFSRVNTYLEKQGKKPIDWDLSSCSSKDSG